jgi:hypothetical protein
MAKFGKIDLLPFGRVTTTYPASIIYSLFDSVFDL